jgi:histidinol-phosphate/aromatic aminotransferase/cobyric acid decarboxylase-like protein
MYSWEHGGDIYRHPIKMDFSVNVNPMGVPESVKKALEQAVSKVENYPDPQAEQLRQSIATMLNEDEIITEDAEKQARFRMGNKFGENFHSKRGYVETPISNSVAQTEFEQMKKMPLVRIFSENIICGNGASELFLAIVRALSPENIVIPIPSFYGYEHAAKNAEFVPLSEKDGFAVTDRLCDSLQTERALLFLANPNNPTGKCIPETTLLRILEHCRSKQITVVLDECFAEFTEQSRGALDYLDEFPNLVIVRAFTKLFAMPGARLGYLLCKNKNLREQIAAQLPEWNLSVFAQAAGIAAAGETDYRRNTPDYVKKEREFLKEQLSKYPQIQVLSGEANFLFLRSCLPLAKDLLEKGILIRDCSNYRGLGDGYYRIAVKSREENEELLRNIDEIHEKYKS